MASPAFVQLSQKVRARIKRGFEDTLNPKNAFCARKRNTEASISSSAPNSWYQHQRKHPLSSESVETFHWTREASCTSCAMFPALIDTLNVIICVTCTLRPLVNSVVLHFDVWNNVIFYFLWKFAKVFVLFSVLDFACSCLFLKIGACVRKQQSLGFK